MDVKEESCAKIQSKTKTQRIRSLVQLRIRKTYTITYTYICISKTYRKNFSVFAFKKMYGITYTFYLYIIRIRKKIFLQISSFLRSKKN